MEGGPNIPRNNEPDAVWQEEWQRVGEDDTGSLPPLPVSSPSVQRDVLTAENDTTGDGELLLSLKDLMNELE